MRHAQAERLRFIDFLLYHYGTLNREVIMDYYAVSVVQASHDIQEYLRMAPSNAVYDRSLKTYRKSEYFNRVWE